MPCCWWVYQPYPKAVPGPGSPYSIGVNAVDSSEGDPINVSGLNVNCKETGVTLSTACTTVTFYFNTLGQLVHFALAAGSGSYCDGAVQHNYAAANASTTVQSTTVVANIAVTRV